MLVGHPTDYSGIADTTIQHTNGHRSPVDEPADFPLWVGSGGQSGLRIFVFRERRVLLRRGSHGFGFNIVGGDGEEGIVFDYW